MNAWKRNSLILATTANICHPAPSQLSRPSRPPPGPHAPGVLPQPSPPRSPNARDAAQRLFLSRLPHPHIAGVPKTTLSVPIQWNVTARNSSGAPPPPRSQSRVSLIAQFRHEPKTSPCERAQNPRGDGDPRLPPSPPFYSQSPTSPKRESCTGRPHPPQDHLTGVIIRLSPRGQGRGEEWRDPRPARTPGRRCTGAKAPNASPAFPGPRRPRRPPSLPGLEAGAAAAAAAAAGGGGRRGSGFVGPGGGGGWCSGTGGGGGGGGRGRRRRVREAGGRVVPVHRGGCVGRAGSSGGSSRALCMGGGRGGRGRGEEEEEEVAAEGAAPSHGPGGRTGGGRAGRSLPGEPRPRRAARPQPGVREAAASAPGTHRGGGGRFAPCWWISQDAPPAPLRPAASPRLPSAPRARGSRARRAAREASDATGRLSQASRAEKARGLPAQPAPGIRRGARQR